MPQIRVFLPGSWLMDISPHPTSGDYPSAHLARAPCAHTALLGLVGRGLGLPTALCSWLWGISPAGVWCAGPVLPSHSFLRRFQGPAALRPLWLVPQVLGLARGGGCSGHVFAEHGPGQAPAGSSAHLIREPRLGEQGSERGSLQGLAVGTWRASIPAHSAEPKVSVSQHTALGLQPLEQLWG